MTAALSPVHPEVQHQVRLAAVHETGRLIATNRNARIAFTLFSKQFLKTDLAQISRANRALARERRRNARLRKQQPVQVGVPMATPDPGGNNSPVNRFNSALTRL